MSRLHFFAAVVGVVTAVVIPDETTAATINETSTPTENCTSEQRRLACELLEKYGANLELATTHVSGIVDSAFASNNVRDMCDGKQAARSSYPCSECPTGAPGGTVCIRESVFKYLAALAATGPVKVHELAGACVRCYSGHYQGLAVDLGIDKRSMWYLKICEEMGGTGFHYKIDIHCHFNN